MKKWEASFVGRQVGAIGVFHRIVAEAVGDTEEEARLSLYDRYEHIHHLALFPKETSDELERLRGEKHETEDR